MTFIEILLAMVVTSLVSMLAVSGGVQSMHALRRAMLDQQVMFLTQGELEQAARMCQEGLPIAPVSTITLDGESFTINREIVHVNTHLYEIICKVQPPQGNTQPSKNLFVWQEGP
ncbi:hypothetical protein [Ferroacidibacillus organovorans]|uniref:Uncharacterized protein n=1 Tax=Ferroacidibacillus organovorans TaxID=1765683 RepID=A0A101XSQ7_9BACL|nr:hypothetical protein [Ferroacidibacillus organovorans]KUO96761.1 hypothetical protein ATW55_08035 [Ferroacidibacillus organovorans]